MNILVDTSIWSHALRRKPPQKKTVDDPNVLELAELIDEGRAVLIGPIRQEILSGISPPSQFSLLKERLKSFDDLPLKTEDYETAAEFFIQCRKKRILGSHIDFLICAAAKNHSMAIFTSDPDFKSYAKILKIELHQPRSFN
ncbi:MAG: PIN domain-containing protein [Candidatus Aminicenantes bacterium]|nr:PIN domain-containing protein [Candidatus Aminicenantes bacterium]